MPPSGDARRLCVIGAGIIGLSIAHDFAARGDRVPVMAAGGLWLPYRVSSPEPSTLLQRSLARFMELRSETDAPVLLRAGLYVIRDDCQDVSWTGGSS